MVVAEEKISRGVEIGAVYDAITNLPPFVSSQPQNQSAKEGEPATFTVNATGPAPLAYQWLFNGSNIVGALSPTLTISRAQLQDAIHDYLPSRDSEMLEYMELVAVFEASNRRMLPKKYAELGIEALQERLKVLRVKIGNRR